MSFFIIYLILIICSEDPLRDLLYDFSQSIEYAMLWYVDREEKLMKEVKKEVRGKGPVGYIFPPLLAASLIL